MNVIQFPRKKPDEFDDGPRHIGAIVTEIVERARRKQLENRRRGE